jgi:hypothetical protein
MAATYGFGFNVKYSKGPSWEYFEHHLHTDCLPEWYRPDVESLAHCVKVAFNDPRRRDQAWADYWTWDARADHLEQVIERMRVTA